MVSYVNVSSLAEVEELKKILFGPSEIIMYNEYPDKYDLTEDNIMVL